ncbi:MAG: GIY-YIG nuclease family protein [Pseudoxanthomonas sp.]
MSVEAEAAVRIDGRCFTYVFPCAWEDFCKIGFSRDPLVRIGALHPRWFAFFDLQAGMLVETETIRDARDLELQLRRPLKAHRAPVPLTIRTAAGGQTEWFRGVAEPLARHVATLADVGYRVLPLRGWLRAAALSRIDRLHDWADAQLSVEELEGLVGLTPAQQSLRDVLDGYRALEIELADRLPPAIARWYGVA